MKNKKIVLSFIAIGVIAFFFFKTKKNKVKASTVGSGEFNEQDAKEAVLFVAQKYGKDLARIVEKMLRWETAHFKSQQYRQTGSAGMEVGKWHDLPKDSIAGVKQWHDADKSDGIDSFYVWKSVKDFAVYLAEYILRWQGDYARWNTTNETGKHQYRLKIASVKSRFV